MFYSKKARRDQIAHELQQIINRCERQGCRGLNSAEREKFNKLADEDSSLEVAITMDHVNETQRRLASPDRILVGGVEWAQDTFRLSPADKRMRDRDPHERAFAKYLRNGAASLDADEQAVMRFVSNDGLGIKNAQTETTTGGGYIIPTGFSAMLEEAKKWFGGIAGVVDKFITDSGNPWPWPTVNDTTNKGRIVGLNTQVTETDIAFNQVTFNAYIGSSDLVLVPLALLEDSYFDLNALVARLLGTRLGRLYNWKCTTGTGTNEPTGIVTAAVAAGSIYVAGGGSTSGETATVTYNDLVELEHKVDPSYRYNPASYFMFSDSMLKILKKLVDGNGRPLWQPGLSASFREGAVVDLPTGKPTILDHPYMINQDMDAPAASKYSALFGDMSTFKVRELRSGTTVMRLAERYADYLQVGYTAFQRFDSNLIDAGTHPVAVLQQSAS